MKFSYMLAPMEGFSDNSFRTICYKYGADLTFTEMARFESLARKNKSTLEKVKINNDTPTVIQIIGYDDAAREFIVNDDGDMKTGEELEKGKELMAKGEIDLSKLDEAVNKLIAKLLHTFPNCTHKTLTEVRKKKLEHWDMNKESSREWLALNMMTEAKAGFRAFNEGPKNDREVDFVKLRQLLAQGKEWNDEMHKAISPQFKAAKA